MEDKSLLTVMQVQETLDRIGRIGEVAKARRSRAKLIFAVLDAIATRSTDDPARIASTVVQAIHPEMLLKRERSSRQVQNDSPARLQPSPPIPTPTPEPKQEDAYDGINNIRSHDHIFENAEKIAGRLNIDSAFLDFLYSRRACRETSKNDWERSIRVAFAVEQIIRDFFGGPEIGQLDTLVDQEAKASVLRELKSPNGTVLITFHGGFVKMAQKIFVQAYPESLNSDRTYTGGGMFRGNDDPSRAMYIAVQSLRQGGVVLIAPDVAKQRARDKPQRMAQLNVLGAIAPAGEAPAFLAHTANCKTAFYYVVRKGNQFVPMVELGPTRLDNERYKEFKDRLFGFISKQIEIIATGDPASIVLRDRWVRLLNGGRARR